MEAEHGRGGYPHRICQAEVAGPLEDEHRGPAPDVPTRTLSPAARRGCRARNPLWQEYRQRHERRSLQAAGVRPSLRASAGHAGQPRAHATLRKDVPTRRRVHADYARYLSVSQRAGATLAARLETRLLLLRTMEVPRHRCRAAERCALTAGASSVEFRRATAEGPSSRRRGLARIAYRPTVCFGRSRPIANVPVRPPADGRSINTNN